MSKPSITKTERWFHPSLPTALDLQHTIVYWCVATQSCQEVRRDRQQLDRPLLRGEKQYKAVSRFKVSQKTVARLLLLMMCSN